MICLMRRVGLIRLNGSIEIGGHDVVVACMQEGCLRQEDGVADDMIKGADLATLLCVGVVVLQWSEMLFISVWIQGSRSLLCRSSSTA